MRVAALALALACLVVAAGALPAPAAASADAGAARSAAGPPGVAKWPSARIAYRDTSGRPRMVRAAVKLWNRATTRVRLVPARRGAPARITITRRRCPHLPTACADYPPKGRVYLGPPGDTTDDPMLEDLEFPIIVHELGHALGLGHWSGCTIMDPYTQVRCGQPPPNTYRCGPQRMDARTLVRLYGGRVRSGVGVCRLPRPPQPRATLVSPTSPVVLDADSSGFFTAELRNDGSAAWRDFDWGRPVAYLEGVGSDGAPQAVCGTERVKQSERAVAPGAVATFSLAACPPSGSGTETVRVRLILERYGQVRRGPTFTFTVTVREPVEPQPPPESPEES